MEDYKSIKKKFNGENHLMISEKRAFERFDLYVVLEFEPPGEEGRSFLGITRNFSSDGFSFESQDFFLGPGGTLECRFKQPESGLVVSVPGEIVWKESFSKLKRLTGIKFREIGADIKNKMLNIMSLAGEVPADFCPGGKEAAIYSNEVSDLQKVDQAQEELVKESEDVQLDETVHYDAPERVSRIKSKKKIALFVPMTAFVAGVALFIAFNEYDGSLKSLVPPSIKQLLSQETDISQPEPVVEDYQAKTEAYRELPETLQSQTVQEEESILTEQEMRSDRQLNVDSVPIPEIDKKLPLFFGDDLIKSDAVEQKTVQADHQQSVPEKDSDRAKEDLINNIIAKQKSIEKNQETVVVKDSVTVKDEKPENIGMMLPEGKDIKEVPDENIQAAMVPDSMAEKPTSAISGGVEKEMIPEPSGNLLEEAAGRDSEAVSLSEPRDAEEITSESVPGKKLNDEKTVALSVVELPEKTGSKLNKDLALILKGGMRSQDAEISKPGEIKKEETAATETLTAALSRPHEINKKETAVFEESFDDNTGNWDIFNTAAASAYIKGGQYHIENKRKTGKHFILHYHDFPGDSDFIIKTDIRKVSSKNDHAYGVVLGAKDAYNNHVFMIIGNQFYLINEYHNGEIL
jgi:hypothetical protein